MASGEDFGGGGNRSLLSLAVRALNNIATALQNLAPTTLGVTTVAALPTASENQGARRLVTDATATTFASTVAGGGANIVPVTSDGTNWIIG